MDDPRLQIANNWLHDMASGLWGACVLLLAVLGSRQSDMTGAAIEAWQVVADLTLLLFRLALVSLAVILVTGAARLAYWRQATPPRLLAAKRPALIGKHVFYVLIYGAGTWWAWASVWPTT